MLPVVQPTSLTFLFNAHVQAVSATLVIDSGARANHASETFVQGTDSTLTHQPYPFWVGDGKQAHATHQVHLPIHFGDYSATLPFVVSRLPPV